MNFFNRTITIFNKAEADGILEDESWYVTVLDKVRVIESLATSKGGSGLVDNDNVSIHIMLKFLDKPYVEPKKWQGLLDKTEAFTLTQGEDFIVVGDLSDIDTSMYDLFNTIKNTYDGVYRITSAKKFDAIPHIEVGGR